MRRFRLIVAALVAVAALACFVDEAPARCGRGGLVRRLVSRILHPFHRGAGGSCSAAGSAGGCAGGSCHP